MINWSFYSRVLLFQGILLLFALVFQLIVNFGVPLNEHLFLSNSNGVKYGVFGICDDSGCTKSSIGYPYHNLFDETEYILPHNIRLSISYLLVFHPISTGFTFVQLCLVLYLCTRAMYNSAKILLLLLLWTVPTFMLALLAFLADLLMFTPHVSWLGWIQLVCIAFVAFAGNLTCVLKRTVTSWEEQTDDYIYLDSQQSQHPSLSATES